MGKTVMSSKITGMLAIGNGEKCPYCDTIMTEDTDTLKHMTENHQERLVDALFGDTDEEYLEHKQKGNTNETTN